MNQKKTLYTLIGTLVLMTTFLGGYLLNQPLKNKNENQKSSISSSLDKFSKESPVVKKQPKLEQITSSKVLSAVSGGSGSVLYIEKNSGKIFEIDKDNFGSQKNISGSIISDMQNAVWSPKGEVLYTKDKRINYLNFIENKTSSLGNLIQTAVFSPDGKKISYHLFDNSSGEGSINISQPDGTIPKNIVNTRLSSINISWPKSSHIFFYKNSLAAEEADLLSLDIENSQLSKVLENKRGLDVSWSKDGNILLYSFFDNDGSLRLVVRDMASSKELPAPFSSYASKCSISIDNKTAYCGIPLNPPSKPMRMGFVPSKDKVVKWGLADGKVETILESSSFEEVIVSSPFLSSLENILFFVNLSDERLYKLTLK